jgi:hypothetical protein
MKRFIAAVAAASSTVFPVAAAAPAGADPDPHMPNVKLGYCPGGTGSRPLSVVPGAEYNALAYYCDGTPYPDGTHWRYFQFPIPFSMIWNQEQIASYGLHCAIDDELVNSSLAGPGGCAGAV